MKQWMDGSIVGQTGGSLIGWMDRQTNGWMNECFFGWLDVWMDSNFGWNGWMVLSLDTCMNK